MRQCFQEIFAPIGEEQPLRFVGDYEGGSWFQGTLITSDGQAYATVNDGIPSFITPENDPWGGPEDISRLLEEQQMKRETLIPSNWERGLQRKSLSGLSREYFKRIVERQGITLEIACGPGGGSIAEIITEYPSAKVLMNDIGLWMLQDWRDFFCVQYPDAMVSFAQFDATRCPIRSNTFDCVNSSGGISNIEHNDQAIVEIRRILKPGGILLMLESIPDPKSFKDLPEHERNDWIMRFPDTNLGYETMLKLTGFKILELVETGKQVLDPKESTLAEIGAKYGITIDLIGYRIIATKAEERGV